MTKTRNFRFVWNNYPEDVSPLSFPECVYLIYGKEIAPTTGTPHLQGHIVFKNPRSVNGVRKLMKGCDVRVSDLPDHNIEYCKKDGSVTESGVRPKTQKQKGELGAEMYKKAFADAKAGNFDAIPEGIRFRYYRTIKEIHKDHMERPANLEDTCGVWYWGLAGSGKTTKAWAEAPLAYMKRTNKWWDGYQGEETVIIDDVDPDHACLRHHFKLWADKFAFIAETKGGSLFIRPKKVIITSQYEPDMIWTDTETRQAISRRFSIQEIKKDW